MRGFRGPNDRAHAPARSIGRARGGEAPLFCPACDPGPTSPTRTRLDPVGIHGGAVQLECRACGHIEDVGAPVYDPTRPIPRLVRDALEADRRRQLEQGAGVVETAIAPSIVAARARAAEYDADPRRVAGRKGGQRTRELAAVQLEDTAHELELDPRQLAFFAAVADA